MEWSIEDPEGPNISAFLCFIRDVDKTHFNPYFRNDKIAKASSQDPHYWKYRSRKYVLMMVGAQTPSSGQKQHLNLCKPNFLLKLAYPKKSILSKIS